MFRLALVATVAAVSISGTSVQWDGMFHVALHCGGTTTCTGNISIRAPGDDPANAFVQDHYSVAAGQTKTLALDPAGVDNKRIDALSSVVVRLEPTGEEPFDTTMKLSHASSGGGGGGGGSTPKPLGPPTKFESVKDK